MNIVCIIPVCLLALSVGGCSDEQQADQDLRQELAAQYEYRLSDISVRRGPRFEVYIWEQSHRSQTLVADRELRALEIARNVRASATATGGETIAVNFVRRRHSDLGTVRRVNTYTFIASELSAE